MLVAAVVVLGAIVVLQLSFVIGYLRDNRAILQNLKAVLQNLKDEIHTVGRTVEYATGRVETRIETDRAIDELQWHKKGTFAHELRKEFQWHENGSFAHRLIETLDQIPQGIGAEVQAAAKEILDELQWNGTMTFANNLSESLKRATDDIVGSLSKIEKNTYRE